MRLPKGRFERLILKWVAWGGAAAGLVFGAFIAGAAWDVWQKEQAARRELVAASAAHEAVVLRKNDLEKKIEVLGSPRGVEAELRERFPIVREGEEVIVIVNAPEVEPMPQKERTIWERFRGFFEF